jgi:hypothetical protein
MIISLDSYSPFYAIYAKQADVINAVLEQAIAESAAKMGSLVSEIYSVSAVDVEEKLAA